MPFVFEEECKKCGEPHGIQINFQNLGDHDCPKCGAAKAIEIGWETEYDLDPITDEDR